MAYTHPSTTAYGTGTTRYGAKAKQYAHPATSAYSTSSVYTAGIVAGSVRLSDQAGADPSDGTIWVQQGGSEHVMEDLPVGHYTMIIYAKSARDDGEDCRVILDQSNNLSGRHRIVFNLSEETAVVDSGYGSAGNFYISDAGMGFKKLTVEFYHDGVTPANPIVKFGPYTAQDSVFFKDASCKKSGTMLELLSETNDFSGGSWTASNVSADEPVTPNTIDWAQFIWTHDYGAVATRWTRSGTYGTRYGIDMPYWFRDATDSPYLMDYVYWNEEGKWWQATGLGEAFNRKASLDTPYGDIPNLTDGSGNWHHPVGGSAGSFKDHAF